MIFPSDRISDLERQVEIKREAFAVSQEKLLGNARQQITTATIVKGSVLGALVGLPTLFLAGKFMMGGGLLTKLMKGAVLMGLRAVTPLVQPLFNSILKQILKRFKK